MRKEQEAFSPAEAGQILGVSRDSVLRRMKAGELDYIKFGRLIRIPKQEIERLLRRGK